MSMAVLRRHYIAEFFRLFAVVLFGLGLVFDLLDLIKKVDDLMKYEPPFYKIAYIGLLYLPLYIQYLLPMAVLVCILFTIGNAARRNELVAVMSAGGRIKRLFIPFITIGFLLSISGFLLGEVIVPACIDRAEGVRASIEQKPHIPALYKDGSVWVRAKDGSLVNMTLYIEDGDYFSGIQVYRTTKEGLTAVLYADKAEYDTKHKSWVLSGVRHYGLENGEYTEEDSMPFPYLEPPGIFKENIREPFEMGLFELRRYLQRLERSGFRNMRLEVDLHAKVSFPMISLFMMVLGVSVASKRSLGGLVATALGLLISLLYWLVQTMAQAMGYAGVMPPMIAAWLTPLIFGAIAAYLYRTIPE